LQLLCERPHMFGVVGDRGLQFLDLLLLRSAASLSDLRCLNTGNASFATDSI